ncbi:MAG: hypothetical protein OHK0029_32580 [Armatimonadaceae bacterium]
MWIVLEVRACAENLSIRGQAGCHQTTHGDTRCNKFVNSFASYEASYPAHR